MRSMMLVVGLALALVRPAAGQEPLVVVRLPAPCRWVDTRVPGCVPGGGCLTGPFISGQRRDYLVAAVAECPIGSGTRPIPLGARGLVLTVVAVGATAPGYLLFYDASLLEQPAASSLNFNAGGATSSMVFTALGQDWRIPGALIYPDLAVYAAVSGGGSVHVVMDIVGYLMPLYQ